MRIAELYESVQGEGLLTGTPSVFVRTSGCNLRCRFCDTPFASWRPEGDDLGVDEIVNQVLAFTSRHVVLTGGEPMLFAELMPLSHRLASAECHVTIETAGTLYLDLHCDLMSISPKLSNSTPDVTDGWYQRHESTRDQRQIVRQLIQRYPYQLKFVVADKQDADEAVAYLDLLEGVDRSRVLLMPEGTEVEQLRAVGDWLESYCELNQLQFCPRRHIQWYGNVRGT